MTGCDGAESPTDGPPHVLVVGLGFIGTHVARALLASGAACTALTRSGLPGWAAQLVGARVLCGDARDPTLLADALAGVGHVVYCAGALMPAESNLHPTTDIETALPPLISVLEALSGRPGVGITFLSSGGTVYGPPSRLPVDERHPTDPITSYGVMKLASEKYVRMYGRLYGVPGRILRCSNVYGHGQPPDRGQGVVAAFLDRARRGRPLVVFGNGSTVRDYLCVDDLAALVTRLMALGPEPDLANVGSGTGTSLNELIGIIREVTGLDLQVRYRPPRGFDVGAIVLDTGRLRSLVPFEPAPLELGIRRTWEALCDAAPSPLGVG